MRDACRDLGSGAGPQGFSERGVITRVRIRGGSRGRGQRFKAGGLGRNSI